MNPSVCHIVNASRDTQLVSDIIKIQSNHSDLGDIGLLSWYSDGNHYPRDDVRFYCVDGDRTRTIPKYSKLKHARNFVNDFDIIHTHYNRSGSYIKIIEFDSNIVVTEHNNHEGYGRTARFANGTSNIAANNVVCVSDSVKDSFKNWERLASIGTDVTVIENGVFTKRLDDVKKLNWNLHEELELEQDSTLIGSAGALTHQKDHRTLIEAVDKLNEEQQEKVTLVISGDGPLRKDLEKKISRANHPAHLHLLGYLSDRLQVLKMMSQVDLYAMSSKWEGFCIAALEAMAMNNICIFSDIESFERPFDKYAHFHTVGSPDSLKSVLKTAINSDSELADRAQEYVLNNYTLKQTCEEYNNIYFDLMRS